MKFRWIFITLLTLILSFLLSRRVIKPRPVIFQLASVPPAPNNLYQFTFKRLLDFTISSIALVLVSPLIAVVALVVRFKLGSPILFRQQRVGYNGEIIEILKFRTMTDERDESGNLLSDAVRLKPVGVFLRHWSLDELPQLWNVIRGDLSLVGPRPLLTEYLPLYTPEQARRHHVKPGITGLAQVNGRNAISWEQKFKRDVEYVDSLSLALDLWIMLKTAGKLVKPDGISQSGHATSEKFSGSPVLNAEPALPLASVSVR